jgi:hypothetical protein
MAHHATSESTQKSNFYIPMTAYLADGNMRFWPWMTAHSQYCSKRYPIALKKYVLNLFLRHSTQRTQVIKHDLQLIAQISSSSEEGYFRAFMINLLELFSTDRRLLDTRGSLIIRQLCLNLNTERIYRTFAEILEKEEVGISLSLFFPTP